jgi:hypothetical protein
MEHVLSYTVRIGGLEFQRYRTIYTGSLKQLKSSDMTVDMSSL